MPSAHADGEGRAPVPSRDLPVLQPWPASIKGRIDLGWLKAAEESGSAALFARGRAQEGFGCALHRYSTCFAVSSVPEFEAPVN